MFDTHCHLNFQAFDRNVGEIITKAQNKGVTQIMIPGTDVISSQKAVRIASEFDNIYAAVGIHPHHIYEFQTSKSEVKIEDELKEIERLLSHPKVVAVGEVGIDRHYYRRTKYSDYQINEEFISLQKEVLKTQIKLAIRYDKSLLLHNREAKRDFLDVLDSVWDAKLERRTVFHCCEPDEELLAYASAHKIFIGVDGDVTYSQEKQGFVKKIPLDMLVLETDAPFLTPVPLRGQQNVPANLPLIASFIAQLHNLSVKEIEKHTTTNAQVLTRL